LQAFSFFGLVVKFHSMDQADDERLMFSLPEYRINCDRRLAKPSSNMTSSGNPE